MFREVEPKDPSTTAGSVILTIHGNERPLDELIELVDQVDPKRRIVAPEAARAVRGRFRPKAHTWFGGSLKHPDPASFGDSLAQLERFIYDVQHRAGEGAPKPWLLGYEQGAVLASTMALIAPDLISGVIAIEGGLPQFSNDDLLEPLEGNLPILFVADPENEDRTSHIQQSASRHKQLGNRVMVHESVISTAADSSLVPVLSGFLLKNS